MTGKVLKGQLESGLPFSPDLTRLVKRILRTGAQDFTDDVLQQTHTSAWVWACDNPDEEIEDLRPWLFAIARNAAYDELRRRSREWEAAADLNAQTPAFAASPEAVYLVHETVEEKLSHLTARQRQVFELVVIEGYTMREVGEQLTLSIPAVAQLITRARARMEEE